MSVCASATVRLGCRYVCGCVYVSCVYCVYVCARVCARTSRHAPVLVNLFLLMVPAGMPELASREDINYLREMLAPMETDEQVLYE